MRRVPVRPSVERAHVPVRAPRASSRARARVRGASQRGYFTPLAKRERERSAAARVEPKRSRSVPPAARRAEELALIRQVVHDEGRLLEPRGEGGGLRLPRPAPRVVPTQRLRRGYGRELLLGDARESSRRRLRRHRALGHLDARGGGGGGSRRAFRRRVIGPVPVRRRLRGDFRGGGGSRLVLQPRAKTLRLRRRRRRRAAQRERTQTTVATARDNLETLPIVRTTDRVPSNLHERHSLLSVRGPSRREKRQLRARVLSVSVFVSVRIRERGDVSVLIAEDGETRPRVIRRREHAPPERHARRAREFPFPILRLGRAPTSHHAPDLGREHAPVGASEHVQETPRRRRRPRRFRSRLESVPGGDGDDGHPPGAVAERYARGPVLRGVEKRDGHDGRPRLRPGGGAPRLAPRPSAVRIAAYRRAM